MRILGCAAAIALLLCIPISLFALTNTYQRVGVVVTPSGSEQVVTRVRDPHATALGVRPGDSVDLTGVSVGDRVRLLSTPVFRPYAFTVVHDGRRIVVPQTAVPRAPPVESMVFIVVAQTLAIGALLLGALILWRRPGAIGLAFGAYVLNFLYALPSAQAFGFLPDPAYSVACVAVQFVAATLPQLALVAFALRFPRPLDGRRGAVVTRVFDVLLIALGLLGIWRTIVVPTFGDFTDFWLDTAPELATTIAVVVIVFVRYARTRGDDQRRLAWIGAGSVASAVATVVSDLQINGVVPAFPWSEVLESVLQAGLPIAFAYAILRHRVLDLGFAINRTLVYSTMTATLVVAVGAVDWLSGKVLGSTHLSSFIEAAVTIAFGAGLSWFHSRVERGVDRLLFRSRYVAAKRIESRIAALGFATKTSAVDEALVNEIIDILHLGSAAVFRRADETAFVRSASVGWESSALELTIDQLLLRTLRAEERMIVLDDVGIREDTFPAGKARPDIAIPIVVRHEFLGLALYGHRNDDAPLDPEEREMVGRLVAAGALAYDAIEAAEWRRRALALQQLPSLA